MFFDVNLSELTLLQYRFFFKV